MTDCANCGHPLGIGRYCTNCGQPVGAAASAPASSPAVDDLDWRTDTAERAPVRPAPPVPDDVPPPPAWTPPPAARFPLFADEVDDAPATEDDVVPPPQTHRHRSRPWGAWLAAAVAVVLVLVVGTWLVSRGDDEPTSTPDPTPTPPATSATEQPSPDEESSSAAPVGLTAESRVTVPETAGPGQDTEGKPVDYEAANMLDGVPETCWRMPGDGTGEELVVTLPGNTRLRSVGMINGYAKQGGDIDWYHGNRRIQQVEWVFDDGTTVPQTLGDTASVQSVDVDVTTTTITLRLVKVSAPGKGSSRRDFTAISDLLFVAR
ncbi:hypothetical protein ASC77_03450 [Nocardioides sp. Root1257]|uniref:NADase-type glycan-binding domain-containing protein n=1 Tax=unclassified Nocardioides TaxID=2615069 RepID=UPI0006FE1F1B|nr:MULTISPECIES: zinc ribbon domain-containing protein [unclassified Nocardioides]KQW53351.1 hypothetical protein ASC77_03450 [Nocardioides sp. Root1257]KRC56037.1 hypothetical protein ASE24_03450 [Nocardioides sp. Root224]